MLSAHSGYLFATVFILQLIFANHVALAAPSFAQSASINLESLLPRKANYQDLGPSNMLYKHRLSDRRRRVVVNHLYRRSISAEEDREHHKKRFDWWGDDYIRNGFAQTFKDVVKGQNADKNVKSKTHHQSKDETRVGPSNLETMKRADGEPLHTIGRFFE